MRQAIEEVVDDSIEVEVEVEKEIEDSIPIALEGSKELRDSIHVSRAHKKKRVRRRKRKHNHPKTPAASALHISDPVPIPMPLPLKISEPIAVERMQEQQPILLQPKTFNPGLDPNVQGVQRNLAQDAAMKELADDADKRVSALKKAREAVLSKLSKEFLKSSTRTNMYKNSCSSAVGRMGHPSSSALVPLMFSR
jgi:hypothetical protein